MSQYIYTDAGFDYAGAIVDAAADYVRKPSSAKYRKTLAKRVKAPMSKAPFSVQRTAKAVTSARKDITQGLAGGIVRCNDSANSSNIKAMLKRADSDARKYPFVGYLNTVQLCAYWKFKPQTRAIDLAGISNRILMFQSEGDPATAYEGALAAHRRTAGRTVLVSRGQRGTARALHRRSVEVHRVARRQLPVRRWRPTADRKCTTSPLPYDRKVYTLSGPVSGAKSTAKKVVKPKNGTVKAVRADAAKRGLS